jgi:hypothetical protein
MKCGDHVVLVGQDHSFEALHSMQDLQSGLVLDVSRTQEDLPAVLVQVGLNMFLVFGFSVMIVMPNSDRPSHALSAC